MPVTSIVVIKEKSSGKKFKYNSLKNKKIAFLKSTKEFQYFEKADETHSSFIYDIIDSEIYCYLNVLNAMI